MESRFQKWLAIEIGGWTIAVIATFGAVMAVSGISNAGAIATQSFPVPSIVKINQQFKKTDYEKIKDLVSPFIGDAVVEVGDDKITIKHPRIAAHAEWQLLVAKVMGAAPTATWEVQKLCAGIKCPDMPYAATLAATVGQFSIQQGVTP